MLVLASVPEIGATEQYLALREALARIANILIIPSMIIAVTTGLLAMAINYQYQEAPWVWAKALSGVLLFEASLMSIDAPAEQAARFTAEALAGTLEPAKLATLVHDEWVAMWTLLALAGANILLAIWRPRRLWFRQKTEARTEAET
ncbi:MAG: hypothetical protein AAF610_08725 [Pseudomonadota bacterium]